ncbi:D-2-hydroxyacid dehydrogenase [Polyangium jinanense]|uniref:D-2-hydroxyacid dehydrogenase n=1 Tax=Polyangium jinanense TaxID=2829994 RepID=A0A9X3X326_9BACT|nr:D-2-hydroxyacid dehydrogenase [Polyangium jinanense]MDC3955299.1 D-2-hydroxyacid dehydrogenase [Polyangium jinanense]MDC3981600.1 D-2-hydroxyacid dehydrogenase [Polyangium jinanense]
MTLTIFCDTTFPEEALCVLREGVAGHSLVFASARTSSNLASGAPDPVLLTADVAFGQPAVDGLLGSSRLRWAHLTSAGYTRYDVDTIRAALTSKGIALTTSSTVYADPCAEHVLAMMLSMARQLPASLDAQRTTRAWESTLRRERSFLLRGQTVLLLGYGAIGRRIAELCAPFEVRLFAFRRRAEGDPRVTIVHDGDIDRALGEADHVVNVLPENEATRGFLDRSRIARLREGAFVYNVGRGTTVDQGALLEALQSGRLGGAYLDVTEVEPLPADHPLWSAPNCFITPHSAGGRRGEHLALVRHFVDNLRRFERGEALVDRVL